MVSVAIVEDHQVFAQALELMMRNQPGFQFAGSAYTLKDGYSLINKTSPDVLLLDIGLPDGDGLLLVPYVKKISRNTQVVVLTCHSDEATLMRAIDSGISGFMSKGCSLPELINTIQQAANGEIILPTSMLVGLLRRMPKEKAVVNQNEQIYEKLTGREQEILARLARGMSGCTIADELSIAPLTVRTHIRNLISKLGVHSRLEAVAFAINNGLIQTPM